MAAQRKMTFGLVVGNRGFFPSHLAKTGREEMIAAVEAAGDTAIVLGPADSEHGAVETYAESQRCAELFKKHADEIDGIIVTLPNFGEERGIVDAIRLSGLKVPVLVQATPDRSDAMTIATRRDSFCGKMSACNNMMQYGIQYSLTTLHTESPSPKEFKADLEWFSRSAAS
jgi:L-fucose isomerase-like protein